jgi:precorrin-2/cobalt-factor-2 C20-methyltransferase
VNAVDGVGPRPTSALHQIGSSPMRKSSVYLPEKLKQSLAGLAERSGHTEAELIRKALERLIALEVFEADGAPVPVAPQRRGPVLIGVGLGPGDPGHVTQLAKDALSSADRVVAVSWTSQSVGRAEMIARATYPLAPIERVVLNISGDAHAQRASLVEISTSIVAALDVGEVVALVTLGDPSLWSVFTDIAAAITERRPSVPVEMVPGITSYQALAAATGITLARTGQTLMVVDGDVPAGALEDPATTVVVYKGARDANELRARVLAAGRVDGAVVGELLGLSGEHVEGLESWSGGPLSYLATVVVPAEGTRS